MRLQVPCLGLLIDPSRLGVDRDSYSGGVAVIVVLSGGHVEYHFDEVSHSIGYGAASGVVFDITSLPRALCRRWHVDLISPVCRPSTSQMILIEPSRLGSIEAQRNPWLE